MSVVVVGAGVAGLAAARALATAGHAVTVLDKGRRAGGRLSTKEFANGARADAGAQLFTIRSERFAEAVAAWRDLGVVEEWEGSVADDGRRRFAVHGGMSRLAAAMAQGLDVRCSTRVEQIRMEPAGVSVSWPEAHGHPAGRLVADAVIVTVPIPQTAALLGSDVVVPRVSYHSVLALMLALDRRVAIGPSGSLQPTDHPVWSFVGDNKAKGTSALPAVTFLSTPGFATARLDDPVYEITDELLDAARPFLQDASTLQTQLHRWRYAMPVESSPERAFVAPGGRIVLAGDAFGAPTIEGAFLSGLEAADRITHGCFPSARKLW